MTARWNGQDHVGEQHGEEEGLEDRPEFAEQEEGSDQDDDPPGRGGQGRGLGGRGRGRWFVHVAEMVAGSVSRSHICQLVGRELAVAATNIAWLPVVRSDSLFAPPHPSFHFSHDSTTLLCVAVVVALAITARAADTGFVDKTYKNSDGTEHKYVVFVPHDYKKDTPTPTILFLHGAGETKPKEGAKPKGTPKMPVEVGIGPAIKKREKTFPFMTIIPQAPRFGWGAGTRRRQAGPRACSTRSRRSTRSTRSGCT